MKNIILEDFLQCWYIDAKTKKYLPIDKYWYKIMELKDQNNEPKYPVISKVVKCCFAICEANGGVERVFSQISHIVSKERNRLEVDSVKGILDCKETCYKAEIDERLMYNAKTAYARYSAKNALKTASAEATLKRKLENVIDEQSKNDARLTEMKEQEKK